VREIDRKIEAGECFGVLGRNGSGKSTLTRLLLGLERPDRGRLSVAGCSRGRSARPRGSRLGGPRSLRRRMAAVLDQSVHWDMLSGWENAYFFARSYRLPPGQIPGRLEALFAQAELLEQAHDAVGEYSFGMRRKLSILQALCVEPELLILDEPTIGLDAAYALTLAEQLQRRTDQGGTTWIAGNCPELVEEVCARAAFLVKGRLDGCAAVSEHLRAVGDSREITLELGKPRRLDPLRLPGLRAFEQAGQSVAMLLEGDPMLVPQVLEGVVRQGAPIAAMEVRRATLRDAFLLKTGHSLEVPERKKIQRGEGKR
jgi:ABC-type multidrug transport system ATPase subunit